MLIVVRIIGRYLANNEPPRRIVLHADGDGGDDGQRLRDELDEILNRDFQEPTEIPSKVWDLETIVKYRDDSGKPCWDCLHCGHRSVGGWNETKVKAHLAKIPGQDIAICGGTFRRPRTREIYASLWQSYCEQRNAKKQMKVAVETADDSRRGAVVSEMIDSGTTQSSKKARLERRVETSIVVGSPTSLSKLSSQGSASINAHAVGNVNNKQKLLLS